MFVYHSVCLKEVQTCQGSYSVTHETNRQGGNSAAAASLYFLTAF